MSHVSGPPPPQFSGFGDPIPPGWRLGAALMWLCLSLQAMWLMLQNDTPEDFVIATGEVHSVREFVEKSFSHIGKTIV